MGAIDIKGYCTLCRSRCGTINRVENDQLVSVRPDPDHPNGSAMCLKGKAAPELVHSPHRVLYPMKRTRPKTDPDPGWVRIDWDEALSTVASRLGNIRAEHGAEAVAFSVTTPSGTPLSDSIDWVERFLRSFGSPNMAYAVEICNWHKDNAHAFTFGCAMPVADYAQADTIVLWGHNPANTWLSQSSAIARGRARGARMVVIDPRPTALAREADVWLPVRPGTDAALALGIVRHLIEESAYDAAFVRRWTNAPYLVRRDNGLLLREQDLTPGAPTNRFLVWDAFRRTLQPVDNDRAMSDALADSLLLDGEIEVQVPGRGKPMVCDTVFSRLRAEAARYTTQEVERITGLTEAKVMAAADLMRGGCRMAYHAWTGVGQHTNATQTERAIATVYALNGSFDRIGGNRQRQVTPVNSLVPPGLLPDAQRGKALGLAERPIGPPAGGWVTALDLYRAILEHKPYPVRALMSFGTNMTVSHGDTSLAIQALEQLEFHVHLDLFETPSSRYADILLPVNTPWEREALRIGFEVSDEAASLAQLRPRMVSPRGESRADYEIVLDLARRLGMADSFFGGDVQAGWNHMLAPTGLSVEALRAKPDGIHLPIDVRERKFAAPGPHGEGTIRGFETASRRVELYSEKFLQHGQPPLAHYVPSAESQRQDQSGDARYPLILSTAKNGYFCHSQHRSLVSLRKRAMDPLIELSPELARRHGIGEGAWVRVATRVGIARFVARLTPGLAEDVVVAEFGWWQACSELGKDASTTRGAGSSNFNSLISADDHDPVSGSVGMRSFRCSIEPDPAIAAHQRRWQGYETFQILHIKPEAEGVIQIAFERSDGGLLPDYQPGQHLQIRLPVGGEMLNRAYSLTGPCTDGQRRSYTIAVRHQKGRLPNGDPFEGLVSAHLHRTLREGQCIEVQAPSGTFLIPVKSAQPLIFLAGGIGITPFLSQLESMNDGDETEIWLYYGNQHGGTHAFKHRLKYHAQRLPNLRVRNHYAAPRPEDRLGHDYDSADFVTAALIGEGLIERRARIYMCGPPPMMDAFAKGLVARGVPSFDIFREVFRSPPGPLLDDGRSFAVQFRSSRTPSLRWTADQGPLLAFAEKQGLQLANGCRVGQCESCAVRIVSGKVRHLHGVEPEDAHVCLVCQAVPTDDLVLDA